MEAMALGAPCSPVRMGRARRPACVAALWRSARALWSGQRLQHPRIAGSHAGAGEQEPPLCSQYYFHNRAAVRDWSATGARLVAAVALWSQTNDCGSMMRHTNAPQLVDKPDFVDVVLPFPSLTVSVTLTGDRNIDAIRTALALKSQDSAPT